jgi:exodeoxyribonuclease VII large subunit
LPRALLQLVDQRKLRLSKNAGALRPSMLVRAMGAEQARLQDRAIRLQPALQRLTDVKKEALARRADRLSPRPIEREIDVQKEKLAGLARRMSEAHTGRLGELKTKLEATDRLRETLGYRATLERGYAVVRGEGQVLTTQAAAAKATSLEIEFADGRLNLSERETGQTAPTRHPTATPAAKPAKKAAKTPPPEQGSLF